MRNQFEQSAHVLDYLIAIKSRIVSLESFDGELVRLQDEFQRELHTTWEFMTLAFYLGNFHGKKMAKIEWRGLFAKAGEKNDKLANDL